MYPELYIDFLIYFHKDRDYFECHEVLEELWKKEDKKLIWSGLLKIAVSLYHQRRGNFNGAKKVIDKAYNQLIQCQEDLNEMGLDTNRLFKLIKEIENDVAEGVIYRSHNLPMLKRVETVCLEKVGEGWKRESDFNNTFIIHKHKRRKR